MQQVPLQINITIPAIISPIVFVVISRTQFYQWDVRYFSVTIDQNMISWENIFESYDKNYCIAQSFADRKLWQTAAQILKEVTLADWLLYTTNQLG